MDTLKAACEDHLSTILEVESVGNVFLLADMHSAGHLRIKCIEFITANALEVMFTKAWKNAAKSRPELFLEAFCDLALKNCKPKPPKTVAVKKDSTA